MTAITVINSCSSKSHSSHRPLPMELRLGIHTKHDPAHLPVPSLALEKFFSARGW